MLRTIGEVAEHLDLPQHVLRFWETRFKEIDPVKRAGGRRLYRPRDIELVEAIRHLLYREGYTIKGVQRILREQGVDAVITDAQRRQKGDSPEQAPAPGPAGELASARVEPPPPEMAPEPTIFDPQATLDLPEPEPEPPTVAQPLHVAPWEEETPEIVEASDVSPAPAASVFNAPVVITQQPDSEPTQLLRKALAEIEECKRLLNVTRR